jgi:ABC-type nickel/cobalt efflux system permease component RcnA
MWHISKLQRQLYSSLAELMGSIQSSKGNPRFLFLLLLAACIYGMIHALGPGHRKTVIFSYFLAEDARLARGIGAGVVMALLHGASAAVIILPLYYLVRGSLLLTFNSLSRYVEMGSFLFLSLFGAVMFLLHLLPLLKKRTPGRIRQGEKPKEESARSSRELLLLILGSGLVPCPGAAMILIFALSLDMVFHGLLAVAAMSVGMAITLSLVALASMGARKGLGRSTRRHHRTAAFLHTVLELGGYGLIMLFGLVMLLGMV